MKKVLVAIVVVLVIAVLVVVNLRKKGTAIEVQVAVVGRRHITKTITGSGSIQPMRRVNVSASAIGKVTKLAVKEGDVVRRGDFLLQIDPTSYQSAVEGLKAAIRAGEATLEMERANLNKVEYDLERAESLFDREVVSEEELRNARVNVDIQQARVRSALERLSQHEASLKKASHELREVRITAEMSGIITALNVEEGENAIMGTLNNPGTVLLTIADLSEIEAEVRVDETEVVFVQEGQYASVKLDAYPDTSFAGVVTEVGNSALRSQVGLGQESVDFKVVIGVRDSIPRVRPGLSAFAEVTVVEIEDALAIPIQCLTVRDIAERTSGETVGGSEDSARARVDVGTDEKQEREGVFVVEGGTARFRPVAVGIAGERYFHVKSGLEEGEEIVSGPFKAINGLKDGDPVKVTEGSSGKR